MYRQRCSTPARYESTTSWHIVRIDPRLYTHCVVRTFAVHGLLDPWSEGYTLWQGRQPVVGCGEKLTLDRSCSDQLFRVYQDGAPVRGLDVLIEFDLLREYPSPGATACVLL